jgi:UDP-glucose 4-epimerase
MHVLVTGGAGFIGRHLAVELLRRSCDVTIIDDLRVEPLLAPIGRTQFKPILQMTADDLVGVDAVVHLASFKSVPESFRRPLEQLDNIDSGRHLLELCAEVGVPRVVVASTCEVYGQAELPTAEHRPFAPRSPYAWSKTALEMLARAHQQAAVRGARITVVRLFNVYGPGERPDALVPRLCRSALLRGELPVEGSGSQRRDLSYVSDAVEDLLRVLEESPGGVVNVGTGVSWSVDDVVSVVHGLWPGARKVQLEERPCEIQEFRADVTALRRISPRGEPVPLEAGVRLTFDWWRHRLGLSAEAACRVESGVSEGGA